MQSEWEAGDASLSSLYRSLASMRYFLHFGVFSFESAIFPVPLSLRRQIKMRTAHGPMGMSAGNRVISLARLRDETYTFDTNIHSV